MDDAAYAERLMALMAMTEGPAKQAELDRFFVDVQERDDPSVPLGIQLEMLVNAYNSGRFEHAAPHVVRTAALYEKLRGDMPDYLEDGVLRGLAIAPEVLPANGDLSAEQVDTAIAKVGRLLRAEGADLRSFELAAPGWPLQRGRFDEAGPLIDRARALADPDDPYEMLGLAAKLMLLRDYDEVLRVLGGIPAEVWRQEDLAEDMAVVLAKASLFLGRFADARRALAPARSAIVTDAEPVAAPVFAEAAALAAVLGDQTMALRMADDTLNLIQGNEFDQLDTLWQSAHLARAVAGQPDRADLAARLATTARTIADRFDRRNGSGYQRWLVDRILGLPPTDLQPGGNDTAL